MATASTIVKALSESPYFQGLPNDILSRLSEIALPKKLAKGEHLFLEGERAVGFYLIIDGMMKLYKLSPKGKESVIHIFGPGEIFAEITLAGQETYPVNAQALTETQLALFPKRDLLSFVKDNPELGLRLIGLLCIRLKNLLKTIENLTLKEAGERLLSYLWELSESGKKSTIEIPIPKSQLALLLGITPETLSRLLQKYKEEGILTKEHKKLVLLNLEALERALRG